MKTRLNGEEGYAEIKHGGVMIFNQFTLIACWLLAQLHNCKLFVVCCLYSLSLFILSRYVTICVLSNANFNVPYLSLGK